MATGKDQEPVSSELIFTNESPYSAKVTSDDELGSRLLWLAYQNQDDPTKSITVGIAPYLGSNLFQFKVGEHDIIYCDRDLLKQKAFTGNFVLWPLPNRIRDKAYSYQGQSYSLQQIRRPSGNEVLVHGLVLDREWQYETPVLTAHTVSVSTWVEITPESPHYDSYPFPSRLTLTYTLTHTGLTVAYEVRNLGTRDLPFGFGLHPYFTLLSGLDGTLVSLPARTVMEADDDLLPTGRLLSVESVMYAPFDLREATPIDTLKLDHVYTDLLPVAVAYIDYTKQQLRVAIKASNDFTHIVLYTPPPAEGRGQFFCLENQTCSTDAINLFQQGKQGMAHLLEVQPGATSSGSVTYTIEHKNH